MDYVELAGSLGLPVVAEAIADGLEGEAAPPLPATKETVVSSCLAAWGELGGRIHSDDEAAALRALVAPYRVPGARSLAFLPDEWHDLPPGLAGDRSWVERGYAAFTRLDFFGVFDALVESEPDLALERFGPLIADEPEPRRTHLWQMASMRWAARRRDRLRLIDTARALRLRHLKMPPSTVEKEQLALAFCEIELRSGQPTYSIAELEDMMELTTEYARDLGLLIAARTGDVDARALFAAHPLRESTVRELFRLTPDEVPREALTELLLARFAAVPRELASWRTLVFLFCFDAELATRAYDELLLRIATQLG